MSVGSQPNLRSGDRGHTRSAQSGFALLITITLLAFLVLLLVSLASLTRVETQVAGNSQQLAQARQNALLALNIAMGEVQRSTGPDRRSTVPADLVTPAAASPRWVGVYGNASSANYSRTPSAIPALSPRPLQWLVSGNESLAIIADSAGTITSATPSFAPSASNPSAASPADAVTVVGGAALSTASATSDLKIGTVNARLLVGPNTVASGNAATDYVAAPLVDINAPANAVPGLPGQSPVVGGYAWWVGDESTKAKINLESSYLEQSAADQSAYQRYSFLTAQYSSLGSMGYDSDPTHVLGPAYPDLQGGATVKKVAQLNQLPLVGGGNATYTTNLTSAKNYRFHDATAFGQGVLADAYAGGLKKDLTSDIANTSTTASGNRPADSAPLFPRQVATDRVPTWGLLRSFPRTTPDASGRLTPSLPPASSTSEAVNGQNVSPVINFAGLGVDFFLDASNQIQVALFPVVILWNPYSAKMAANSYEIGFRIGPQLDAGAYPAMQCFIQVKDSAAAAEHTVATLDLGAGDLMAGAGSGSPGFVRFKLDCSELAPGEAQVYIPGSSGLSYVAGQTTLVRSPVKANGTLPVTDNYVTWTLPGMAINPAVVTGGGSMRVYAARNLDGGIYSLDVVLSKPGGLSGWDGSSIRQSDWYQTVADGNLGQEPRILNDSNPKDIFNTTLFSSIPTGSNGPSTYMRLVAPMEAFGGINSNSRTIGALSPNIGGNPSVRWLLVANPRAPVVRNTLIENQGYRRGNTLLGGKINLTAQSGGNLFGDLFLYNGRTSGYNTKIGRSQNDGYLRAVLFDVLASSDLLLSLGQLQHASLAPYGFYSTYPFGNSWAPVQMPRQSQYLTNMARRDFGVTRATVYDLSWHLNRALWDHYFVSGVPSAWTDADIAANRKLPNGRMGYYSKNGTRPALADIRDTGVVVNAYDKAAANLWVDGAFNVNSTSEQAWRALLGATLGIPTNAAYADPGDAVGAVAAVPRFSGNQTQPGFTNSMTQEGGGNYVGNRGLRPTSTNPNYQPDTTQAVINELARSIVAEVKARGPFLSVADFVNRRLVVADPNPATPAASDTTATGLRGTLQAAIDKMGTTAASTAAVNTAAWTGSSSDIRLSWKPRAAWDDEHYLGALLNPNPTSNSNSSTSKNAARFAACPKYLTQADLLSLIGPALTVRGDTFLVRTYGETRNPVTGDITARAWCEAVLQRLPDYMDASMAPETDLASAFSAAPATQTNRAFGRRYKVVSFRWLSPSDI